MLNQILIRLSQEEGQVINQKQIGKALKDGQGDKRRGYFLIGRLGIPKISVETIIFIKKDMEIRFATLFNELLDLIPQNKDQGLLFLREEQIKYNMEGVSPDKINEIFKKLSERQPSKKIKGPKKNWKTQEIQLLIYITDKYCYIHKTQLQNLNSHTWQEISQMIPSRSSMQCMFKMLSVRRYSLSEHPWSEEQDQLFRTLLQQHNMKWDVISRELFLRSPAKIFRNSKQCKEHYMCFFNPNIRRGSWSIQQDYALACCYLQIGKKWSKIAKIIQGRNENAVKNRFYLLFGNLGNGKNRSQRDIKIYVLKFKKNYQAEHILEKQLKKIIVPVAQKQSTQENHSRICQENHELPECHDLGQSKLSLLNIYQQNFAEYLNL